MVIYSTTKDEFVSDVFSNKIGDKILSSFIHQLGHTTSPQEIRSWQNSMLYMNNIVSCPDIPGDAGIAIEYQIPNTTKRVDFIITGLNESHKNVAVIVELKQWTSAGLTSMDGVVRTYVGRGIREMLHPSYQVRSYAMLMEDFNAAILERHIELRPCAYLHNYEYDDGVIRNDFYKKYLDDAPVFLKNDASHLLDFMRRHVKYGDRNGIIEMVENGRIRPSKQLASSVASMLSGNEEFTLIDDQKFIYEKILRFAEGASRKTKKVFIVEGGPGTGKSVVAINLLAKLIGKGQMVCYATRNSAPRLVFEAKLTRSISRSRISSLFKSTGSFVNSEDSAFDTIIVDEAHRLNEKSGMYGNLGENQIKEIIEASKYAIFFVDEDQRVTFSDIGSVGEITRWAKQLGASVDFSKLSSQFRCSGSDGYLAWLDNALAIRETANTDMHGISYDFRVVDSPSNLHNIISQKNEGNNKSRMVAGYCWKWLSKNNPTAFDIIIGDYRARWNLKDDGQTWIIRPDSVSEVGCIHTCQGLELDYVGVIVGPDFKIRDGRVITNVAERASSDRSVWGYKRLLKEDPERAQALSDMVIKNTYRTLMTRGMKGCYIYCTDQETQEYFSTQIAKCCYSVRTR